MKKFTIIIAMLLILVGCKKSDEIEKDGLISDKKVVTVTTSFLFDIVDNLARDYINTETVIPAGENPHLYVAKPKDLQKINEADLILYQGLGFEGKLTEAVEDIGYSVTENFPKDQLEEFDKEKHEEHSHGDIDPHFWFDIDLYKLATKNVSEKLIELVPEEKENIEKNTEDYIKKLTELDENNEKLLSEIPQESRYLITPHESFGYFSRRYNIPTISPQGLSSSSEVSNKDIQDTVDFIVDHKIKAVFAETTTDYTNMEKLKEECESRGYSVKVVSGENNELLSDSLAPMGKEGATYIDMYKHNVNLIVKNLK